MNQNKKALLKLSNHSSNFYQVIFENDETYYDNFNFETSIADIKDLYKEAATEQSALLTLNKYEPYIHSTIEELKEGIKHSDSQIVETYKVILHSINILSPLNISDEVVFEISEKFWPNSSMNHPDYNPYYTGNKHGFVKGMRMFTKVQLPLELNVEILDNKIIKVLI